MKVNVDNAATNKKNKHNLSHEVSTTMDFGFVQPLMVDEIEPGSSINIRVGQVLRLSPMPCPTFGDVKLKTYHNYVKTEDLYHAFPQLLAGLPYSGVSGSYIPNSVPSVSPGYLYCYLRCHGQYNVVELSSDTAINNKSNSLIGAYTHIDPTDSSYSGLFSSFIVSWYNLFHFDGQGKYFQYFINGSGFASCQYNPSLELGSSDWAEVYVFNSKRYCIFGRFGTFSKNLLKVLIGCGFELNNSSELVSSLPLFAYFKTWFDLFNPAREKTWSDTYAFRFLELCEQRNLSTSWFTDSVADEVFCSFLESLTYCYYTLNVDFAAAHIDGSSNDIVNVKEFDFVNSYVSPEYVEGSFNDSWSASLSTNSGIISQAGLRILKALDKRINTHSVIGGRLHDLLKSIYGSNYDAHDSDQFGSQQLSANIDDVMSTAETSEGYLGEYAGKGLGNDSGKSFKFTPHDGTKFGYIVTVACVVPHTRMSQGMDMQLSHCTQMEFFDSNFDSLTLLPTAKKYIYGSFDIILPYQNSSDALESGFGNIPNYIEQKFKKNITNGDMRMMSTRQSFLPYTLDRLLPYSYLYDDGAGHFKFVNMDLSLVINGVKWRYIGLYNYIGNYNRIFVNSGNVDDSLSPGSGTPQGYNWKQLFMYDRVDDNFIVHNYFDYSKLSPAKSVADSWNTDAYGDHLTLEES